LGNSKLIDFERLFNPKSLAVVGASATSQSGGTGILQTHINMGFSGHLYPINPNAQEVLGLPAYPSIRDVPEPLDYVIVAVPALIVPKIIEDCAAKQVPFVNIHTAGFSETGDEKMKKLEDDIVAVARKGGVRLIGPNCMGIYRPASGMGSWAGAPRESGPVAFVSQSGGALQQDDQLWQCMRSELCRFS
jgi:acyl-CoA synthetase (NDP forming)